MTALSPDTMVEEANMSFQISTLRKALGESGRVGSRPPQAWLPLRRDRARRAGGDRSAG